MKWFFGWVFAVLFLTAVICIVVKFPVSGTNTLVEQVTIAQRIDNDVAGRVAQLSTANKANADAEATRSDAETRRASAVLAIAFGGTILLMIIALASFILRPPWAR